MAVAFSLLAMHQLSSNHTAAGSSAAPGVVGGAPVAMSAVAPHLHGQDHSVDAGSADRTHVERMGTGQPTSEDGGCPGCAGHHVMALTCVAALILLAVGWVLAGPLAWRGVRLRRLLLLVVRPTSTRLPVPRSLTELSVSRT